MTSHRDTEYTFYVENFTKVYPKRIKHVQYKKGYHKRREGVKPRDLWLNPLQYDSYIESKRNPYIDTTPILIPILPKVLPTQLSFFDKPKEDIVSNSFSKPLQAIEKALDDDNATKTLQRSRRRSKVAIKDILSCNDFDMFVTFSFSQDRYDIDKCKKRFSVWIHDQQQQHKKKGYKTFQYMAVPEYHADKKAIHFHALLNNYKGKITPSLNKKTNRPIKQKGKLVYNISSYKAGFTNMTYIVHKEKTINYIVKYVTKDMMQLRGKRRYWYSKDLKKPEIRYNQDHSDIELTEVYKGDNFTISTANVIV